MRLLPSCFLLLICAGLTACGGGGSDDPSLGERLASAPRSVVDPNLCSSSSPGYLVIDGECHKRFTELDTASVAEGDAKSPRTTASPQAASVTPTALFNWAQAAFPYFFPGAYAENSVYVGNGTFYFRYYYATDTYLGVLNGYVYLFGALTGWVVTPVGALNDFYCAIYGCAPARGFITWTNSGNGVVVKDADNESFAFYSDTRCLYCYARQQETTNFCLSAGSYSGWFAGVYVEVVLATSTTGGCIAVLADWYGRQVDIYTNSAGIQIVSPQYTYWETRGCT